MSNILKAVRKNTFTTKQSDFIFDKVIKEYMIHYNESLNHIHKLPAVTVYVDTTDVVCVAIAPTTATKVKEVIFPPQFFAKQVRGMVIAKANDRSWTNTRLKEEFAKGMKIEFNKRYLNK